MTRVRGPCFCQAPLGSAPWFCPGCHAATHRHHAAIISYHHFMADYREARLTEAYLRTALPLLS
jgi:hypothetical protein